MQDSLSSFCGQLVVVDPHLEFLRALHSKSSIGMLMSTTDLFCGNLPEEKKKIAKNANRC
jgi:hypothetical protein